MILQTLYIGPITNPLYRADYDYKPFILGRLRLQTLYIGPITIWAKTALGSTIMKWPWGPPVHDAELHSLSRPHGLAECPDCCLSKNV